LSQFYQLRKYLQYLLAARDEHHIHSPFVFDLYTKVVCRTDHQSIFAEIESMRGKLLNDKTLINITDYGSGSFKNNSRQKRVSTIAKNSLKGKRFARLLYRLVKFQQPGIALELGTSLGVTSLYQTLGLSSNAEFFTLEGCPEISKIAQKNFESQQKEIKLIEGNIDETLPVLIRRLPRLDYVFFDANHATEPTLNYFQLCLKKKNENTLFIFDDIHRSIQMEKAWHEIKKNNEVTLTIDFFQIGLVFFKTQQPKQDFVLKF
jgi:predicted O-methyltransferase YrrM